MSELGKFYPELEIREEEIEILKGKSGGYLHLVLQKSLLAVEYLRQGCTETVRLDLLRRLNEFIEEHHTPALEDFNTVFTEVTGGSSRTVQAKASTKTTTKKDEPKE